MRSANGLSKFLLRFSALFLALFIPATGFASQNPSPQTQNREPQTKADAQALINQAKTLLQARQYEKAADALKQAIALQPDSAAAHAHLSIAALRLGRASEALAL